LGKTSSIDTFFLPVDPVQFLVKTGPNLFYNEKGPSMGSAGGGEIYIDCQPVGSSEDTTDIITDMGSSPYPTNISDWLKNPLIKLFLGSIIFIIILYIVKYLLNIIKPTKGGSINTNLKT
jgi:hypothetical protein